MAKPTWRKAGSVATLVEKPGRSRIEMSPPRVFRSYEAARLLAQMKDRLLGAWVLVD